MMSEALVARIRYHIKKANFMGLKDAESTILLDEAADAIEELSKVLDAVNDAHNEGYDVGYWAGKRDYEPKWIPVTEKLPEKNGFYLCCYEAKNKGGVAVDEGLSIIQYLDGKWHLIDTYKVTHWIPIPEPPEGEN